MNQFEFINLIREQFAENRAYGDWLFTKDSLMLWIPDYRRHINQHNRHNQTLAAHGINNTQEPK